MTKQEATRIVTYLKGAYPWATVEEATLAVYAEHLADREYEDGITAVRRWTAQETTFPAVSELLRAVDAVKASRRGLPAGPVRLEQACLVCDVRVVMEEDDVYCSACRKLEKPSRPGGLAALMGSAVKSVDEEIGARRETA